MKELSPELLAEVTGRIIGAVHPEKIVLFGSHVWGVPTDDSDVEKGPDPRGLTLI